MKLRYHGILAKTLGLDIPERTYRHGLRQLLEREFLYESLVDGLYFVNIRYMFNGDRLTFIRGYKLKGSGTQAELPLDDVMPVQVLDRQGSNDDTGQPAAPSWVNPPSQASLKLTNG